MERHFQCTACGKCCYGWLPLTLKDALANAGRLPLAMILTTVRQGAKAFDLTAEQGTTVALGKRKRVAIQITPTSYIPPSFSCPALTENGECGIHADKPSRCKTMPFSPFREERDQAPLLIAKPGWECDTSKDAPVVYRDKEVVDRADFDHERKQLMEQAATLRGYADALIAGAPNVAAGLQGAARKARGGCVILNFTTLLPRLPGIDQADFARRQLPVLTTFAERCEGTPELSDYHRYYRENIAGMEGFLARSRHSPDYRASLSS